MGMDVYFVGITSQTEVGGLGRLSGPLVRPAWQVYPTRLQLAKFAMPLLDALADDAHVVEITSGAVLGRYGISQELSVGMEIIAGPNFRVQQLAAVVFRLARDAGQRDAFVARVLPADEWSDNARPGFTVLFKEPQRIGTLQRLRDEISTCEGDGWPIDGFTSIPVRSGVISAGVTSDPSVGLVAGLRYIFMPEISVRWDRNLRTHLISDEDATDIILLDQSAKIGRLCRKLEADQMIERAWLNWFDVIVGGIEDYDDLISRLLSPEAATNDASMSRKPFSELLGLTNSCVLARRLEFLSSKRHD